MAKRVNYRFERAERERQQAQRRAQRDERRAARRSARTETDGIAETSEPVVAGVPGEGEWA